MSYNIEKNIEICQNCLYISNNYKIRQNIGHLRPVPPVSEGEVDARFKSNL